MLDVLIFLVIAATTAPIEASSSFDATSADDERVSTRYLSKTMWDNRRTVACSASTSCLLMALVVGPCIPES